MVKVDPCCSHNCYQLEIHTRLTHLSTCSRMQERVLDGGGVQGGDCYIAHPQTFLPGKLF